MKFTSKILLFKTTILDRYLFREFFGPFLLAVAGFVIIGIVDILFTLVDMFINSGVAFSVVFRLLIYKIPAIMVLFFPMAVLFAVMLLMVRLAKDNELTVLRSSGVHMLRVLLPVFVLALFVAFLSYFTNEKIVPWANNVSDTLIRKSIEKKPPPEIAENVFFREQGERYFYIKKIDSKTGEMSGILIFEENEVYPRIITAKSAFWDTKTWVLKNGKIQELTQDGLLHYFGTFSSMEINVDRNINSFYSQYKTSREMDSKELKDRINILDKGGVSTKALKVEYYMKASVPAACFIFSLIGIAFCFSFVRSGKDWKGVVLAVCIAVLTVGFYFFLMAVFRSFGRSGFFNPWLAAWFPNIFYGIFGGLLISYEVMLR